MRFRDIPKLLKKSQGQIMEVEHKALDYYTVKIRLPEGFNWVAGEYAVFVLKEPSVKGKTFRAFSIASVPQDGYVLLGTRTGKTPSAYKQYIIDHGVGTAIDIRGPMGDFKLRNDNRPVVIFAGGVGITPVRALLKSIGDSRQKEVHLIYPSGQYHLFQDEIDLLAKANPSIQVAYLHQPDEAQEKLITLAKHYGNAAYYYISGSGSAIRSIKNLLKSQAIINRNMLSDHFYGYK